VTRPHSFAGRAALLLAAAVAPAAAQTGGERVSKDAAAPAAPVHPAPVAAARATAADMPAGALPLKYAPRPTSAAITPADLMTRLYIFADDSMQGRDAGTPGNARSNAYIERELRRLGLTPAGENGTFFQDVPLVRRAVEASALTVAGEALAVGADFQPVGTRGTLRPITGRVETVFGGMYGDSLRLTGEQVAGKLVVFAMPEGGPRLPARLSTESPLAGAAGVAIAGLDQLPVAARSALRAPSVGMSAAASSTAPVPIQMMITARAAERMMGRPLAGLAAGTAGRPVEGRVGVVETATPARNIVAVLEGSDAALRNSYVALGAHNDHVGTTPTPVDHDSLKVVNAAVRAYELEIDPENDEVLTADQRQHVAARRAELRVNLDSLRRLRPARLDSVYNGADDDGSGSMALLEIAESMVAGPRPRRSVLFVWHAAEEKGLLGARWFSEHATVPRDSIVAQLNIDMIGRGTAGDVRRGGPGYVGLVGARRLSTELGELTDAVNRAQREPLRFDYTLDADGHPQNIYCRSDHFHYARFGIPIAFFFTGLHGDYHQLTDEPQYIDYANYARITRYVRDLAVRVADLDHRPVVDKPKPDPNGECRQ